MNTIHTALQVVGLLGSMALVTGCAAAPDSDSLDSEDGPVATAEEKLGTDVVQIYQGHCNNDGVVIRNGGLYRLGAYIGADVTGISRSDRSVNGPVCHNTTVWQQAANYMCNTNLGGSFSGAVSYFNEYVDGQLVRHPASTATTGLFFGFENLVGPCDTPSQKDYAFNRIECCMGPATP